MIQRDGRVTKCDGIVKAFEPILHRKMLELWGVDSVDKVGANGGGISNSEWKRFPSGRMSLTVCMTY